MPVRISKLIKLLKKVKKDTGDIKVNFYLSDYGEDAKFESTMLTNGKNPKLLIMLELKKGD